MLQEIIGHASITTTLDLYGHLYPGIRTADRLDSAAGIADLAKIRPDDRDDDPGTDPSESRPTDTGGALGGTRTPTF